MKRFLPFLPAYLLVLPAAARAGGYTVIVARHERAARAI